MKQDEIINENQSKGKKQANERTNETKRTRDGNITITAVTDLHCLS